MRRAIKSWTALLIALLCGAASGGPDFPDEPFRANPPAPAAARPLVLPALKQFPLKGGITVYLVERHQLPTISLELSLVGGAVNDPPGKEGLASLCMGLLNDGTQKLDRIAFNEALADLASTVSSQARAEDQSIGMTTLRRNLDATLDLWADTLLRPAMQQEELARNVKQRLDALKQAKGAVASLAARVAHSIVYGSTHPHGRLSTEASLQAVTLEDCKRYVADYLKPAGARLFVVGDITAEEITDKLGPRLAPWQGRPRPSARLGSPTPPAGRIFFVDVPGAPQSVVQFLQVGPARQAKDYPATLLMSGVLGGSFASRINMNLREKHGYAYGARGGYAYNQKDSVYTAGGSVRSDVSPQSIGELYKELRAIRDGDISEEELTREKSGILLGLPGRWETGGDVLRTFQLLVFFGLPLDYYKNFVDTVQAVTKAQVRQAAVAHLQPGTARILVVGDGKKVLPGLQELLTTADFAGGTLVRLDADGKRASSE